MYFLKDALVFRCDSNYHEKGKELKAGKDKEENEEVAEYIQSLGMKLLQQQYHKGYEIKADTLYSAFFSR